MLYITGQIKDRSYKEEPVQPGFLLDVFKGLIPDPRNGGVDFRIGSRHIKVDEFGQRHKIAALNLPTKFDGTCVIDGEVLNIAIQYATSRTNGNFGQYEYVPHRLEGFNGEALAFGKDDMQVLDAYVYYALFPLNENSPFHVRGTRVAYSIFDREKEARENMQRIRLINEVQREIFNTDFELLRIKAAGLSYRVPAGASVMGFGFGITKDELISQMSSFLNRDGRYFIEAWNDQGNILRGMVQFALDEGIILHTVGMAGGPSFAWSQNGVSIVDCGRSEDGMTRLVSRFADDAGLMNILQETLNTRRKASLNLAENLDIPDMQKIELDSWKDADPLAVVEYALAQEVIHFDRASQKLIMSTIDGGEKELFDYPKQDGQWKATFVKNLRSPSYFNQKKLLVERIRQLTDASASLVAQPELALNES